MLAVKTTSCIGDTVYWLMMMMTMINKFLFMNIIKSDTVTVTKVAMENWCIISVAGQIHNSEEKPSNLCCGACRQLFVEQHSACR